MRRSKIFDAVAYSTAEVTDIPLREIMSSSKKTDVAIAKGIIFYILKKEYKFKPATTMRYLQQKGWRSCVHSTLLKGFQRAERKIEQEKDEEYIEFLDEIMQMIKE